MAEPIDIIASRDHIRFLGSFLNRSVYSLFFLDLVKGGIAFYKTDVMYRSCGITV